MNAIRALNHVLDVISRVASYVALLYCSWRLYVWGWKCPVRRNPALDARLTPEDEARMRNGFKGRT